MTAVRFGDYLLLKRIAVGGMAELFLAEDQRNRRMCVIKRILPYLATEPDFVQMFLDEARIAAQLHHPNIIEVKELGKLDEHIFIAMEFVDGIDLRRVLQQEQKRHQAVPYTVAAYVVARICDGLAYAHNRVGLDGKPLNLIHRDISPQNVMVAYTGEVTLVDFGIAKASAVVERSKPGVIKGKYLYLAPEQLTQDKLDHRADLFAVGTMLYEITTGKSPFARPTTEAVILAIRNDEPTPPHLVQKDFPLALSRIITRCMAKDRTRRYQQAAEIRDDLDDFVHQSLPMTQDNLASYIARLFGTEDDRTVMNLPERPGPPVPDAHAAPLDENTASTASGRALEAALDLTRPSPLRALPPEPARHDDEDDDEPKTQTARPQDLAKALAPPPSRKPTSHGYAQAGSGEDRTQMADESTRLGPPEDDENSELTPANDAYRGRRPTPSLTPVSEVEQPPTREGRGLSAGGNFDPLPELPPEPKASNRRRPPTAQAQPAARKTPPKPAPPALGDEDDESSTADFRLSRVKKSPLSGLKKMDGERWAMVGAALLLVAGLLAVGALLVQRMRAREEPVPTEDSLPTHDAEPKPKAHAVVPTEPDEPEQAVQDAVADAGTLSDVRGDQGVPPVEKTPDEVKPPAPAARTAVIFKAPAGTRIKVNNASVTPGKQYRYPVGVLKYVYRCPARGSRMETRTERLSRRASAQTVLIKCSK